MLPVLSETEYAPCPSAPMLFSTVPWRWTVLLFQREGSARILLMLTDSHAVRTKASSNSSAGATKVRFILVLPTRRASPEGISVQPHVRERRNRRNSVPDFGSSAAHGRSCYRCSLPGLAGFAGSRCTE